MSNSNPTPRAKPRKFPLLRTWVNTFAGETFGDAGDVIDHNSVMERREEYDGEVPDGVFWPVMFKKTGWKSW